MGKDLFPPVIESGIEFSKVIFCRNEPFKNHVDQDHVDLNSDQGFDVKIQQGLADTFNELIGSRIQDVQVVSSVKEAMDLVEKPSAVLVTGSLYLVTGALTVLKQEV